MSQKLFRFLMVSLFAISAASAGLPEIRQERGHSRGDVALKTAKKVDVVKVVPHVAASDDWKSTLLFRNDLGRDINLFLDFYDPFGATADVLFRDSDGSLFQGTTFDLQLGAFEVYTLEFETMADPNLVNFQIYIFSTEEDADYGVENSFHNFQGSGNKVASVAGGLQEPHPYFFMNMDIRQDPFSFNTKVRGLAVTNVDASSVCDCSLIMWDSAGNQAATATLSLDPLTKWVGNAENLFQNVFLPTGLGVLDFSCNLPVGVTGLSFETNSPIVGSVPIDQYVPQTKRDPYRGKR